jgi:NADPH-dependent 2,4-dienoyl-CoA reductase/sulfur reductase-like enzyme
LIACAVNPRAGREADWGPRRRTATPARVVVAGAGPGGLEAARVAAERGHDVVVFEQAVTTGGQLRVAAAGPTREELLDFVFHAERELGRLGVDVRLGTTATREAVLAESPALVVVATGATPTAPQFDVAGGANVVTVWDLLGGAVNEVPGRALVLDDGSGFWHGVSAAEYLAERGADVELVTPARGVGLGIPHESVAGMHPRLRENGVTFRPLTTVTAVDGTTVRLADVLTGEPALAAADLVVVQTELHARDALLRELDGVGPAVAAIGDCSSPRRLSHAVLDANTAIHRFEAGQLSADATVAF